VKESVTTIAPVFAIFVLTHALLLIVVIGGHAGAVPQVAREVRASMHQSTGALGMMGALALFVRAYSLGGGTYTGIEAVSNGVSMLREPRVITAKKTMLLMATSLAFTAGGILLCYLLNRVVFEPGRTLNATLWTTITRGWHVGRVELSGPVVAFTLIAEGALLFVAAQTGFLDGPRTLAAMAVDEWVPKRFKNLSERLVTQNGVLTMGIAAAAVLIYARGAVNLLVVMYSINVFLTFTLSQFGMAKHWFQVRKEGHWKRRLVVNAVGAIVTATILVITASLKFGEGGWVTLVATGALIALCLAIRSHYRRVRALLASLDEVLLNLPLHDPVNLPELVPDGPTAIVLVESYSGLGVHTLLSIYRLMPKHFKNFVFVSVGLVDSAQFKGADELGALEAKVRCDLESYVSLSERMGAYAEYRYALGTDLVDELEHLCTDLVREFRRSVVFTGQLVFQRETLFTRTLHHETAFSIQRRLQFAGIQVIVLPIRVWERTKAA